MSDDQDPVWLEIDGGSVKRSKDGPWLSLTVRPTESVGTSEARDLLSGLIGNEIYVDDDGIVKEYTVTVSDQDV